MFSGRRLGAAGVPRSQLGRTADRLPAGRLPLGPRRRSGQQSAPPLRPRPGAGPGRRCAPGVRCRRRGTGVATRHAARTLRLSQAERKPHLSLLHAALRRRPHAAGNISRERLASPPRLQAPLEAERRFAPLLGAARYRLRPLRRTLAVLALILPVGCSPPSSPDPELLDQVQVAFKGHAELDRRAGGGWAPFYPLSQRPVAICLDAPALRDTSGWKLSLALGQYPAAEAPLHAPSQRLGNTLCFEYSMPDDGGEGWQQLCPLLVDDFDGRRAAIPCLDFRFSSRDPGYYAQLDGFNRLMKQSNDLTTADLLARLESMERDAEEAGFPFLSLRCRLTAAYFARRSGEIPIDRMVSELRSARPDWLGRNHSEKWSAVYAYELAALLAEEGHGLQEAWNELRHAEEMYRRIGDPDALSVSMLQADILARVGAPEEGIVRLERALELCEGAPCRRSLVTGASSTLTWLTLQDPLSTRPRLERVASIQREAIDSLESQGTPIELGNAAINLAFVNVRLGGDPRPALLQAEAALNATGGEAGRSLRLQSWAVGVRAQHGLQRGEAERSAEICRDLSRSTDSPQIGAWARSCLARAERARGDIVAARDAIEAARVLHRFGVDEGPREDSLLGPSARSQDSFLAALLALDDSAPDQAWTILEEIDRSAGSELCLPTSSEERSAWNTLLLDIAALEGPASREVRRARSEVRRNLMQEARELLRSQEHCAGGDRETAVPLVDFRAFAAEGEIVLLRRHPDGTVAVDRRAEMEIESLGELLQRVNAPSTGHEAWLEAATSLAEVLAPTAHDLDAETSFAAHGLLQRVPWSALPIPSLDPPYLGLQTSVVHYPTGAPANHPRKIAPRGRPLFVVDPTENLPGSKGLAASYRRLFPESAILQGEEATSASLIRELPRASSLHIDAHGTFEPAFPELSAVILADGAIPAAAWAGEMPPMLLANLSTCGGGRWPVTADSGRFGLAGTLARRGAQWVIASRADLPNRLAVEFNGELYRGLRNGMTVPQAYRGALTGVSRSYSPQHWAALMLLRNPSEKNIGQSAFVRTLDSREPPSESGGRASRVLPEGDVR
ncbi:hypothetical protein ABI59_09745 [Acidobacteria bacterium Mor1]|nr:hypothetical protein ABI59_09745 [Acidobacteria bacterium Mor1]